MPNYSQHVQFRLDERHGKLLADRAAVAGVSANLIARRILEERLDKNEDAILHGLNFLAEALSALATRIDRLTEEQTAKGWITRPKTAPRMRPTITNR